MKCSCGLFEIAGAVLFTHGDGVIHRAGLPCYHEEKSPPTTPTPRTDDTEQWKQYWSPSIKLVPSDFARQLETELTAALRERDKAVKKLDFLKSNLVYVFESGSELDDLPTVNKLIDAEQRNAELLKIAEELADKLTHLGYCDGKEDCGYELKCLAGFKEFSK